jgi:hypothetical protein
VGESIPAVPRLRQRAAPRHKLAVLQHPAASYALQQADLSRRRIAASAALRHPSDSQQLNSTGTLLLRSTCQPSSHHRASVLLAIYGQDRQDNHKPSRHGSQLMWPERRAYCEVQRMRCKVCRQLLGIVNNWKQEQASHHD